MTVQPSLLFVAGLGYSATHLARIWPGPVTGTVRSEAKAEALRAGGIDARVWDGDSPLQPGENEAIYRTAWPSAVLHRRQGGTLGREIGPVLLVLGALRDPVAQQPLFVGRQRLAGLGRRHEVVVVAGVNAGD